MASNIPRTARTLASPVGSDSPGMRSDGIGLLHVAVLAAGVAPGGGAAAGDAAVDPDLAAAQPPDGGPEDPTNGDDHQHLQAVADQGAHAASVLRRSSGRPPGPRRPAWGRPR